jgi:ubiquinone/menaquinone biosynthesis C-methylase UbiE
LGGFASERKNHNMEQIMSYPNWLNEIIRCPETGEPLTPYENAYIRADGKQYPIVDGILSIVYPESLSGADAGMNRTYEWLAPFYDFSERFLGRIFTGVDMVKGRREIVSHLKLVSGIKLLEVSPGPGVFQRLLWEQLADKGELVSLDLSMNMLRQCQKRNRDLNVHLIHGNAQYLPFANDSFDALFHFGGVNLFNDPDKAVQEFIRVVKQNGLVSWGDEGFSPNYPNNFRKEFLSRMNPGFLKPMPQIPESVYDVRVQEVYDGHAYLVVAKKK